MTTMEMLNRQDLMDRQTIILNENGIQVLERRDRQLMVVVSRDNLDKATDLKIDSNITIASRA